MPENWSRRRTHLPALWVIGIFLTLALTTFTTPALAHRLLVFAFAEGDTIHTESKFISSTPVRQGKVEVLEQNTDKVLLTGQTDDQGKFSFKIPAEVAAQKRDLKILVEAAMGHRGEWLLKAGGYLTATPGRVAAPVAPASASATTPVTSGTKAVNVDQQALEAALNKALEGQLAPIKEMLTQLTVHRTALTDIIGGIGYILGIFGLWAYFQSKGKKNP